MAELLSSTVLFMAAVSVATEIAEGRKSYKPGRFNRSKDSMFGPTVG